MPPLFMASLPVVQQMPDLHILLFCQHKIRTRIFLYSVKKYATRTQIYFLDQDQTTQNFSHICSGCKIQFTHFTVWMSSTLHTLYVKYIPWFVKICFFTMVVVYWLHKWNWAAWLFIKITVFIVNCICVVFRFCLYCKYKHRYTDKGVTVGCWQVQRK